MGNSSVRNDLDVRYPGIKAILARRELSQRSIAEALEVHSNTVSSWLNGSRSPNVDDILAILMAAGLNRAELLDLRLGDILDVESRFLIE